MLLEDIQLQPLQKIELLDPWPRNVSGTASRSLLAGAMILHFDHTALVCTSPLRFMRCQSGTTIAKPDGIGMASLGYRITHTKPEECPQWHPTGLCKQVIRPEQWLAGTAEDRSAVHVLLHAAWDQQREGAWALKLRFVGGSYCLTWRPYLDGSIEFAPAGQQHTIDSIAVNSPADAFGWLHPAYHQPLVLDERCWHSAKVSDWPWPLRKALQSHQTPEVFYRDTLRRALTARFRQAPLLRQRLLALRLPTQVKDVPDGLIEEIAEALRLEP
jgi:hypothetical protein